MPEKMGRKKVKRVSVDKSPDTSKRETTEKSDADSTPSGTPKKKLTMQELKKVLLLHKFI